MISIRKNWRNAKWIIFTYNQRTGEMKSFTREFKDYVHLMSYVEYQNSIMKFKTGVKVQGYEPAPIESKYVTVS